MELRRRKACPICGKDFEKPSHVSTKKWCSRVCYYKRGAILFAKCHPDRKHYGHGLCDACYKKAHIEQIRHSKREYMRRYRLTEKGKEAARKYKEARQAGKYYYPQYAKEYSTKHKDQMRFDGNRSLVLEANSNLCVFCGKKATSVHHVDGDLTNNSLDNLWPCCHSCHGSIHDEYHELLRGIDILVGWKSKRWEVC